jgi:hypothetical protein
MPSQAGLNMALCHVPWMCSWHSMIRDKGAADTGWLTVRFCTYALELRPYFKKVHQTRANPSHLRSFSHSVFCAMVLAVPLSDSFQW